MNSTSNSMEELRKQLNALVKPDPKCRCGLPIIRGKVHTCPKTIVKSTCTSDGKGKYAK